MSIVIFLELREVAVFCDGWCYWCHGVVVVVSVLIGTLDNSWLLFIVGGRLGERGCLPPWAGHGRL